jgi:cobalamin biosynthesis Mg chelatase CobN
MRKYLLIGLLCIVSLLVIGCGGAAPDEETEESPTAAPVATEAPVAEATEAPEATEEAQQEAMEEEEEAEEPPPMRLRSQTTTKSQHMAYVSYSTPTRHVESSYLLRKPKGTPSKGETGGGKSSRVKAQQEAKPRPQSSGPPATNEGTSPDATSSIWSSILSFALLVVMFAVVFLAYEHYTSSANSFVSQGLSYLKQFGILKE